MRKVSHWWNWRSLGLEQVRLDEKQVIHYEGDAFQPRAYWWNLWWKINESWKNVLVLMVPDASSRGFYVCFRLPNGQAKLCKKPCHKPRFAVVLGDGPCDFFILNQDLKSEDIFVFDRCDRSDPPKNYRDIPIY